MHTTSSPCHQLSAARHAELVDRLCELPDGPDRRKRIIEALAELGGICAAPLQEADPRGNDRSRDDSLTEAEKLILHLFDDFEEISDLGRR